MWFPHGEGYGGLTDRHLIVSTGHLADALGLLDDIVLQPDELIARLGIQDRNIEKYIHFHLRERGLLDRTRLFPYVMYHGSGRWRSDELVAGRLE